MTLRWNDNTRGFRGRASTAAKGFVPARRSRVHTAPGAHLTALPIQILLMLAESANLAQKLVRLDEEPGAQQKGEEVRPIGIIFLRRHHVLYQRLE